MALVDGPGLLRRPKRRLIVPLDRNTDALDLTDAVSSLKDETCLIDSPEKEDPPSPPDRRPYDARFAKTRAKLARTLADGFLTKDYERAGIEPRPAWMADTSFLPKRPPKK
jgi:hypothetical protein